MHRNSKVVLILSFCLITTAVLAAGRCVPCKLNHYCVDGLRYQCPANTPVTQGTGAGALNECLTCVQRNGNSANPIYDDLVGDCVSCYEYDSSTPYWNGTTCTACPTNTAWDTNSLICKELEYTCAFEIAHNDTTLCLVESALSVMEAKSVSETYTSSDTKYGYILNTDEDEAFLAKYGIEEQALYEQDYWAGAMKYCQDKGLRLPTMDEMSTIFTEVYGFGPFEMNGTTLKPIKNQTLFNFLATGSADTYSEDAVYMHTSEECTNDATWLIWYYHHAVLDDWINRNSGCYPGSRPAGANALCLK